MAIDSATKRKSIASLALPFLIVGITPIASATVGWRQTAGWSYSGIASSVATAPTDDDADTNVTTRTDVDGNTVRPARLTIFHAAGGARHAELVKGHRAPMDRYMARSSRAGRTPTACPDTRLSLMAFSTRAGDSFAVREILLALNVKTRPALRTAKDTTNRTDVGGNTLRVPQWELLYAASSALPSALRAGSTHRDRFSSRHTLPTGKRVGFVHAFHLRTDGRAGSAGSPMELLITAYAHPEGVKAKVKET